jgi:hypothetical protein
MMTGAVVLLGFSLLGGMEAGTEMNPEMEMSPGVPAMEDSTQNMEDMEEPGMESK